MEVDQICRGQTIGAWLASHPKCEFVEEIDATGHLRHRFHEVVGILQSDHHGADLKLMGRGDRLGLELRAFEPVRLGPVPVGGHAMRQYGTVKFAEPAAAPVAGPCPRQGSA